MTPRRVRPSGTRNAFIFSNEDGRIRPGWTNAYDDGYGFCWSRPLPPNAVTKPILYRIRVIPKGPKP